MISNKTSRSSNINTNKIFLMKNASQINMLVRREAGLYNFVNFFKV